LAEGDKVLLTARSPKPLHEIAERYADRARVAALDVTQPEQIARAVRVAEESFGSIDVLVNNAGYGLIGALEETRADEYRPMFEVNFFGAIEMIRAVLPLMRRQRRGHIVNISSIAGLTCRPGYAFYGASKFALEGASEALAQEVAPLGIKVTLVEPGPFRTEFAGRSLHCAEMIMDHYAATSGVNREQIALRNGKQPGDPVRAARIILEAVRAEQPPLHLPVGSYAYGRVREKVASLMADVEAWEARAGKPAEFS
jgi:short-subunit dehydrogenase